MIDAIIKTILIIGGIVWLIYIPIYLSNPDKFVKDVFHRYFTIPFAFLLTATAIFVSYRNWYL